MTLSHFTIELDPPNAPSVRIDSLALPVGSVQGVQIEHASPNELPQLILIMSAGQITVNGDAVVSVDGTESVAGFLGSVDVMALSEAAAALQGQPDPRNPGRYLDSPTEAYLAALTMMAGSV
jgi:hypothetical protein